MQGTNVYHLHLYILMVDLKKLIKEKVTKYSVSYIFRSFMKNKFNKYCCTIIGVMAIKHKKIM